MIRKTSFLFGLAFVLALVVVAAPASAASVTINGPTSIWVPYADAVTVTWSLSASFTPTFCEWNWNGTVVSNGTSYTRTFYSPHLDWQTQENATLGVYVSNGSQAASDSLGVRVRYESSCGGFFC